MTEVWSKYKHRLAGGWRATSYLLFDPSSPSASPAPIKPHGDSPLGRVIITPSGYLSAHLAIASKLSKPLPSGQPWQTAPENEVAWVARGLSMYCGYMKMYQDEEAEGDEGLWWETEVEVCSDPSRFGGKERRRVRFIKGEGAEGGERVELRPFQDLVTEDGKRLRGVITWERFE